MWLVKGLRTEEITDNFLCCLPLKKGGGVVWSGGDGVCACVCVCVCACVRAGRLLTKAFC